VHQLIDHDVVHDIRPLYLGDGEPRSGLPERQPSMRANGTSIAVLRA
jgi:hypothetical protein